MPVKGIHQSPEHIRKRTEAMLKTRAAWSEEKRAEANQNNVLSYIGQPAWNKGKKCPQYSGSNHWNWGNNMPQESIEKTRKKLTGVKQSPERIKNRFDSRAGYRHSPETKAKIGAGNTGKEGLRGELNKNWRGGTSCEPYAPIWIDKRFKAGIRERDNHTCQNPDCRKNGDYLVIHHVNYQKKDCEPTNLITLCNSCNCRANYNRDFWQAGYTEIIRLKYEAISQSVQAST